MKNFYLAEKHINLVYQLSNSLMRKNRNNPRVEWNDLTNAGYVALLVACEHYDASSGIPFEHYANRTIRRAMIKQIDETSQQNLVYVDNYEPIKERRCCNWDDENSYLLETLQDGLNWLSPEERHLVEIRFGFYNTPLKLRELGTIMNISCQVADKRLKRILKKLHRFIDDNRYTYSHCA